MSQTFYKKSHDQLNKSSAQNLIYFCWFRATKKFIDEHYLNKNAPRSLLIQFYSILRCNLWKSINTRAGLCESRWISPFHSLRNIRIIRLVFKKEKEASKDRKKETRTTNYLCCCSGVTRITNVARTSPINPLFAIRCHLRFSILVKSMTTLA